MFIYYNLPIEIARFGELASVRENRTPYYILTRVFLFFSMSFAKQMLGIFRVP